MRHPLLAIAIAVAGISGMLHASRPGSESVHKVRKGETASRIAREHGLSMAKLKALNPRQDLSDLSIGTRLLVAPEKSGSSPKTSTHPVLPAIAKEKTLPLQPIQALPSIPNLGQPVLVHLERLLPATLHPSAAPLLLPALPAKASSSPQATDIQAVMPYSENSGTITPALAFEPADVAHLDLLWPVATRTISSAWGPRMRSRTVRVVKKNIKKRVHVRFQGTHKGVDLTAPVGTDVYAAQDGIVITSGKHRQFGNFVVIDHGNGVTTVYGHHKRNFVREGDMVRRGQKIAEVGRTGNATGSHLHFELRLDGVHQNPLPYLNDSDEIPAELVAQNQAALPLTRR